MIMISYLPLFLLHTSASMNQRTYLGTSLFSIAKASVETFLKVTAVKFRQILWLFNVGKLAYKVCSFLFYLDKGKIQIADGIDRCF